MLLDDLRGPLRSLRRNPQHAVSSALLIAFGVALLTATFALVDAVLLRKLPAPEPDRLVSISGATPDGETTIPLAIMERIAHDPNLIQTLGWSGTILQVTTRESTVQAAIQITAGDYYALLGARPQLGRLLQPRESEKVAVVSDWFWRQRLGADLGIIGSSIKIGSVPVTVVGVTTPEFRDVPKHVKVAVTVPLETGLLLEGLDPKSAPRYQLDVTARLRPESSVGQLGASLNAAWSRWLAETLPAGKPIDQWSTIRGSRAIVKDGSHGVNYSLKRLRNPLLLLLGFGCLVLLVVCANLAGLLLARSVGQQKQMAIQLALGSTWVRQARVLIFDALVVGGLGALLGILLSAWTTRVAASFLPSFFTVDWEIGIDARVAAFAALAALLTALLSVLVPLSRLARIDAGQLIKSSAPASSGIRKVLTTVQVALSVVALSAAALFVQSLSGLHSANLGFEAGNLTVVMLAGRAPYRAVSPGYFADLIGRVRGISGVDAAAIGNNAPMEAFVQWLEPVKSASATVQATTTCAFPGYFAALGVPFAAGSDFVSGPQDGAIVNRGLAALLFPSGDAMGKFVEFGSGKTAARLPVIGVVNDLVFTKPTFGSDRILFRSCAHMFNPLSTSNSISMVVRSSRGDQSELIRSIQREVERDDAYFVYHSSSQRQVIAAALRQETMLASVSTALGTASTLLASIGLFALLSFLVTARMRDLSIRVALGATGQRLGEFILREILPWTLTGLLLGAVAALALSRLAGSTITELRQLGVLHVAEALALSSISVLLALWYPIVRATKADAMDLLRGE